MIDHKKIAQRIRELRKAGDISQELLAEWAGMSTVYIGRIERGECENVSLSKMAAIAETLCVSLDYLVFGKVVIEEGSSWTDQMFSGCSEEEKEVLISMLKALKQIMIENRNE